MIPSAYDYGDSEDLLVDDSLIRRTMQSIEQMAEKADDITTDILQMFDLLRININETDSGANNFMSQSLPAILLSLSAGMVTWAVRGGAMLASMISAIPVWKGFDPLPMITASKKRREDKGNTPEDTIYNEQIDGIFESSSGNTDTDASGNTTDA